MIVLLLRQWLFLLLWQFLSILLVLLNMINMCWSFLYTICCGLKNIIWIESVVLMGIMIQLMTFLTCWGWIVCSGFYLIRSTEEHFPHFWGSLFMILSMTSCECLAISVCCIFFYKAFLFFCYFTTCANFWVLFIFTQFPMLELWKLPLFLYL